MGERDLLFLGHMLDTAKGAIARVAEKGRETFDEDEDFRLSLVLSLKRQEKPIRRFPGSRSSGCATRLCMTT